MRTLGVKAAIVDGQYVPGDVAVDGEVVVAVGRPPGPRGLAIPGMVDLQVNGYAGVDFLTADADAWTLALRSLAHDGVTSVAPTFITSAPTDLAAGLAVAASAPSSDGTAHVVGVHLEGPFLSPHKAGTHPIAHLRPPDWPTLSRWLEQAPVRILTIAPELPGSREVIARAAQAGLLVSLGHSAATAQQAQAGFTAGARSVTHAFNAMTSPTSRDAGLAGVALARSDVTVMLICDGVHLQADVVNLILATAGDRVVLVSDTVAGARSGQNGFRLGEVEVRVVDGAARRADGTLAGSVLTMLEAVRRIHGLGLPLEQAVAAATSRPADLIGDVAIGRLRPGDRADVAILADDMTLVRTLVRGRMIECEGSP